MRYCVIKGYPSQEGLEDEQPLDNSPAADSDEPELLDKDKEKYELWHRRFAHLGPAKIAKLHEVTTLKKAIKVPERKEVCEVCNLTKMRNKFNKHLSKWKDMFKLTF
jgi:hypothetical protein